MPKFEEVTYRGNLVGYPMDPAYCAVSDFDLISCLMFIAAMMTVAPPDYTTGSRQ
jgi:hypothetical protein